MESTLAQNNGKWEDQWDLNRNLVSNNALGPLDFTQQTQHLSMSRSIMSVAKFFCEIGAHIIDLKPTFKAAPNPISLLQLLESKQWRFFLVSSLESYRPSCDRAFADLSPRLLSSPGHGTPLIFSRSLSLFLRSVLLLGNLTGTLSGAA